MFVTIWFLVIECKLIVLSCYGIVVASVYGVALDIIRIWDYTGIVKVRNVVASRKCIYTNECLLSISNYALIRGKAIKGHTDGPALLLTSQAPTIPAE